MLLLNRISKLLTYSAVASLALSGCDSTTTAAATPAATDTASAGAGDSMAGADATSGSDGAAGADTSTAADTAMAKKTLAELAAGDPQFSTLVTAISAAGLLDTLGSAGPFTVFAPTNDAFAKIPKADLEAVLKDKALLTAILTHHVIAGKVEAKDVKTGIVTMVDGTDVQVTVGKEGVMVGKSMVTKADIMASNGVIHIVDTVILPPADIVDTAVASGSFKTLEAALTAADLITTLKGKGPFTVFAPNDAAFAKIAKADLDAVLADKKLLTSILTYHVVPGKVYAKDVKSSKVKTVNGAEVTITADANGVMVDGAKVLATDIISSNGVIHIIDAVVMPPK